MNGGEHPLQGRGEFSKLTSLGNWGGSLNGITGRTRVRPFDKLPDIIGTNAIADKRIER